jgi:hypothetical protein
MRDNENSLRTEGTEAGDNMSGANASGQRGPDLLSMLSEIHTRLSKVEADNASMRGEMEAAKNRGDIGFDYEHAQHVLTKFFPHDKPAPEVEAPAVARFDAFTGHPLH